MYKVLKTRLKLDKKQESLLKLMSHIAKNIYNLSLYELRQEYFRNHKILSYYQIKDAIKNNPNYKLLHPYEAAAIINESIQALKLYDKFHNFDGTVKSYYENNKVAENYKFPKYKKKNSFANISFALPELTQNKRYQSFNIPNSYLILNGYAFKRKYNDQLLDKFILQSHLKEAPKLDIILPRILYKKKIKSTRIVPKANGEEFEIQYLYEISDSKINYHGIEDMAIDLGVTNLATCITTNLDSFIVDGKIAKSLIRLYNKKIREAKILLPFKGGTKKAIQNKHSKYLEKLFLKFNDKEYVYINTAVNILLKRAVKDNVGRIILGWNDGFKEGGIKNITLTNRIKAHVNQSFLGMPLAKFRDTLIRKAKILGIKVFITDESYTSKVSFYDNEPLNNHDYLGTRLKRGLFERPNGRRLNADINGALNIYRKFIIERNANTDKLQHLMCSGVLTPDRVRVI